MKKIVSMSWMIFLLLIIFSFADAQSQSAATSISLPSMQSPEPSVQLMVSIPDEYSSHIVRENGANAVYFHFKKSDGTRAFLFQVNKIEDSQWIKIKDQLSQPTVLAHKNGFIYYALITDKSRIKGPDNEAYEQIYNQLRQLIGSIVITE